jgi:hypothetical protein
LIYGVVSNTTYTISFTNSSSGNASYSGLNVTGLPTGVTSNFTATVGSGSPPPNQILTVTNGATTPAGTYTIIVSISGGVSATNTLIISPKSLGITAANTNKVYGSTTTFNGGEFTATGLVNGNTVTSVTLTSAGTVSTAGTNTYSITPSAATGTGLTNYSISYTNGTLTVTAKSLGITAANTNKVYGSTTTFNGGEFTASGLVNGNTVTSVSLASAGTVATAVINTYSITPSAANGTGLTNYSVSYTNGTLTVTPKSLGITAANTNKVYGSTTTFNGGEFTASGLVNGNTVTSVSLASAGTVATAGTNIYSITPSAAAGTGLTNYTISYTNGTLAVSALQVSLTGSRAYDGTTNAAAATLSIANIANSDSVTVASGTGGLASSSVGLRAITSFGSLALGGLKATNYTLSGASGSVTITQASPSLSLSSSLNPCGYKDSIHFTASIPADAAGNVTFLTNGLALSTNSVASGSAVSATSTNLPRATTNVITAIYGGDSNYLPATNSLTQTVTNHPPVAGSTSYARNAGIYSVRIIISDVLTNVTDVDGDSITLTGVGTSTNGVSSATNAFFIGYFNTNAVNDRFTYSVRDNFGGTATNVIIMTVTPATLVTGQQTPLLTMSGSSVALTFYGLPNNSYVVQRTTNLVAWVDISTNAAATNGVISLTDTFSDLGFTPASAYYRLRQ